MRVPSLVSEFIEWRWAPCVGLTAGSLAFVALSLLLIPAQIESTPALAEALRTNRVSSAPQQRALFGASLATRTVGLAQAGPQPDRALAVEAVPGVGQSSDAPAQRGFSPPGDRPPAPTPEAAPPLPSEPGRTYLQQPEPGGPIREVTAP